MVLALYLVAGKICDNRNALPIAQVAATPNPRGTASQGRRPSARGRAPRRRGASNTSSKCNGPTLGWKIDRGGVQSFLKEKVYLDWHISQLVLLFVKSALQRLKLEVDFKVLTNSRADFLVLFMGEVVQACPKWLIEFVCLKDITDMELSLSDMYLYLAVLL